MPVRVLDRPAVLLGLSAASGEGGREPGHGDQVEVVAASSGDYSLC